MLRRAVHYPRQQERRVAPVGRCAVLSLPRPGCHRCWATVMVLCRRRGGSRQVCCGEALPRHGGDVEVDGWQQARQRAHGLRGLPGRAGSARGSSLVVVLRPRLSRPLDWVDHPVAAVAMVAASRVTAAVVQCRQRSGGQRGKSAVTAARRSWPWTSKQVAVCTRRLRLAGRPSGGEGRAQRWALHEHRGAGSGGASRSQLRGGSSNDVHEGGGVGAVSGYGVEDRVAANESVVRKVRDDGLPGGVTFVRALSLVYVLGSDVDSRRRFSGS